jgi:hypothetical protein
MVWVDALKTGSGTAADTRLATPPIRRVQAIARVQVLFITLVYIGVKVMRW